MSLTARLRERLRALHATTDETPLYNPVFQLSLELSRELEGRTLDLDGIAAMVAELECEALQSRAGRLRRLVGPVDAEENLGAFRRLVEASAEAGELDAFRARWERPLLHAVFTGHPTFLLTHAEAEAVADAAVSEAQAALLCARADPLRQPITLAGEHADAMAAIARAAKARDALSRIVLEVAAEYWPKRWKTVRPMPFRLASWVGYDMDGRTDISWATSLSFRLGEKAERLAGYAGALENLSATPAVPPEEPLSEVEVASRRTTGDAGTDASRRDFDRLSPSSARTGGGVAAIARGLRAAEAHSREMAALFSGDLSAPSALVEAADRLTRDDPAKLLSLAPVIAEIEALAATSDAAADLLTVAAAMRADGLGMGWIHFRVNSSQLQNAIRRRIDPEGVLDLASRGALTRMRELLAEVKPLRSNFAALAIENTTALRQFLAMAQILHHVDADTPIRMLIAECEQPQTVLAALYFAKLFGIDDKVDVSPLFETEEALAHGDRFLAGLLGEEAYRDYARARGRVAIQTGFSDAGRFVGQIPAALAIERLQGRLAQTMADVGLGDVPALIFNTHGESMGRGAHPSSMADRLRHPMSAWARVQFAKRGIPTEIEASFQGGDGYLLFGNDALALATLTRIAEVECTPPGDEADPFYERTDISLDFYRGIRSVQRSHLESRTYSRAITAFGLGLLNETGSRKSRRQSDLAADREMSLRQIRAIPHNAILQQLGYPVNVIAGAGTAAAEEMEALAELIATSPRGQALLRLLRAANGLASIKSVAAYGELFNSAYWASRTYRGAEAHLEDACLELAERLTKDDRTGVFRRLTSRLRVDGLKLRRLLEMVPADARGGEREEVRRSLGILHALRLALMQHMFLHAVQVPVFSRSNDISRDDVLEMIFSLRIEDAVAQLRRAFPTSAPSIGDFPVAEATDYPDGDAQAYSGIEARCITPIARAYGLCLRISTAVANHFGAHG